MAGAVGRELLVTKNAAVIAGLRTATITWGGASINVTSGEDDGKRLLLEASGEEQIDLKCEGISKDEVFVAITLGQGNRMLTDIEIEWPSGATLAGDFRISSYEEGAPYNDAITFSMTLESSGDWTYTPAP